MLAIALLVLGVVSRLFVHAPNFTPVVAIALFGGVYLKRNHALLIPLVIFAVSDLFLGPHATTPYVWGSIVLIALVGMAVRKNKTFFTVLTGGLGSAVLFFIVTNLGVWLSTGLYPQTVAGLVECFEMAIPFFRNTLVSTVLYGAVLFGIYEILASRLKDTRFAHVL